MNILFRNNRSRGKARRANGGGFLYPLSALPEPARVAYLDRLAAKAAENSRSLAEITDNPPALDTSHLKDWQRRAMDARLAFLVLVDELAAVVGLNAAIRKIESDAREGCLPAEFQKLLSAANARGGKSGARTVCGTTIKIWRRKRKDGGAALAPGLPPIAERIPLWLPELLAAYRRPQCPSLQETVRELNERGIPVSYDQARRAIKNKVSRLELERGRLGPMELRAKRKMYKRRDLSNAQPLDIATVDGHSSKARVAHPFHGRAFYPEQCGVVDAVTRFCIGWSVGFAESAHVVAGAVLHAVSVNEAKPYGGIPAILYSDLGAGNTAKRNTDEVTGLFARLGILHKTGIPGNAKGRGLIERAQRSLWIRAASKLPTFTGKTMSREIARKVYLKVEKDLEKTGESAALIPWNDYLQFLAHQVDRYNRTPHRGLPKFRDPITGSLRHMSPMEAWDSWLAKGWRPTVPMAEELEDWSRPQKTAVVQRGLVSLAGNVYGHPDLEHHHGKKVIVEFDFHDASMVRVRELDGRLICKAAFDYNKTDFFPVSMLEKARDDRAKNRLRNVERKREEIEQERKGPRREAIDLTPEQVEAFERLQIETLEVQEAKAASRMEEEGRLAALAAEIPKTSARPSRMWATPQERYESLLKRRNKGEVLSEEELNFMADHEERYRFREAANDKRPGGSPTALGTP